MVDHNTFGNQPGHGGSRMSESDKMGASCPATSESGAAAPRKTQARQAVADVADRARQRASEAAHHAGEHVTHRIDSQKDLVASRLSRIATSIRDAGQCFAENDETGLGHYVESAADRLEGVGDYLQGHTFDDLRHETAAFLRRHPEVGLAGAFVGGLLIARFLRASASHDRWDDEDYAGMSDEPALRGGYEGSSAGYWGPGHSGYGPGRGVITPASGVVESSGPTAPGHAMARGQGTPLGGTIESDRSAGGRRFDTGDES